MEEGRTQELEAELDRLLQAWGAEPDEERWTAHCIQQMY
jgi:hypothetical protein